MVGWDFLVVLFCFVLYFCCFTLLPLIKMAYERKTRVISAWSGNGQLLAQLLLLWQTKKGQISSSESLPQGACQCSLWAIHSEVFPDGDGPQSTERQVQGSRLLPSMLRAQKRNSEKEVEQVQKIKTRMELLQHRIKCCINAICNINVVTSSATTHFEHNRVKLWRV